jgi:hypothetical protein
LNSSKNIGESLIWKNKVNTARSVSFSGRIEMVYPPRTPRPLKPPGEPLWPSPTPLPIKPSEDIGKTLKQVLDRLDAIEKRLDNIEKLLAQTRPTP